MDQQQGSPYATTGSDTEKLDYLVRMGADSVYAQILPWINLAIIILGWFSISVEVFLRHSFGERYLNALRLFLAMLAMSIVIFGAQVGGMFGTLFAQQQPSTLEDIGTTLGIILLQLFYYAFFGFGAWHLWRIRQRNKRGERWYSYSFGVSRLNFLSGKTVGLGAFKLFTIDDWNLYRFIEPALIWAVAIVVGRLSSPLGSFFSLAAITMFIKNNYVYGQVRGRILDMIDAEIEQDHMEQALRGEDKRQTAGFTLVRPPYAIDRDSDGIPDPWQRPAVSVAPAPEAQPANRPDFSDDLREVLGQEP